MKKVFTFVIALMGMFAVMQNASALVYTVTVPVGTQACFISGDMNSWSSPLVNRMTKVDATHFTLDIPTAKSTDGYKYYSGSDWKYEERDAAGVALTANRTYNAADVVAKWAAVYSTTYEKDVTIDVLVPATTIQCYIVGSFNNGASPDPAYQMTKLTTTADGIDFSIRIHTLDTTTLTFQFCAGPAWSYQQSVPSKNYHFSYMTDGNAVVVTSFNAIYDPAKIGTINIKATVPAGTSKVWIMGDFIGWNWANLVQGTKNVDGTFSFAIPLVQSIEYKLYNGTDWAHVEVDAASVEVANRKAAYPTDANTNVTVIGWKTPTAVSRVNADNYKIYPVGKTIVVEGVTSQVDIIDLSGRSIQSQKLVGNFTSKALTSGLYIVRVDGAARKISLN